MATCKGSIEIQKPVQEVWDFVNDPSRLKEWLPTLVEERPLNDILEGVGARFEQTYNEGSRTMTLTGECTFFEPTTRMAIILEGKGFSVDVVYDFEEISGGTRVTQHSDMKAHSFFLKLFMPLMRRGGEKRLAENFSLLKEILEAEPTAEA